jgi:hypothetical protein
VVPIELQRMTDPRLNRRCDTQLPGRWLSQYTVKPYLSQIPAPAASYRNNTRIHTDYTSEFRGHSRSIAFVLPVVTARHSLRFLVYI